MRDEKVTVVRTRLLVIVVDGQRREEVAGERTAPEVQHELRFAGKSVRVWEHYR